MSSNIFDISQQIFNNPPQSPKSIQILLDEADNNTIFELLVLFLLEGISTKFTNSDLLNLDNLSEEQLYDKIYFKFHEYLISIGFNIFLKINKLKPLNFQKIVSYFPDKSYNFDFCTLFLFKKQNQGNTNEEIYIEYMPTLKSDSLLDYILIISTKKFMLEIKFDFFIC